MELAQKKELMEAYGLKLEKAIAREIFIVKEIENDNAALKYVENQKNTGASLENSPYEDYETWIEAIKKQIKKGENGLKNIAFKKVELEAIKVFIA